MSGISPRAMKWAEWVQARSAGTRALLLVLLGALGGLGQAPLGWYGATLVALFLWFSILAGISRPVVALGQGWLFGTGYFLATLFWIVEPFMVEADKTGWMAPFALVFMAGGLALFWAAAFGGAAWIGRTPRMRIIGSVILLSLYEMARSYVLTGFPWALPGYVWFDTPLSQAAAFVGPHGLVALTLMLAALPLVFRRLRFGATLALVLFAALWQGGMLRLSAPLPGRAAPVNLRLIQPNAAQAEKWDPRMIPAFFQRQLALSSAPAKTPPDLVIWPETAIPYWLDEAPAKQRQITAALPAGSRVILGARRTEGRRFFNTLAVLGADGRAVQTYDKAHLVPFGEYIPFGSFLARFGVYGLAAEDGGGFTSGNRHQALLDLGTLGKVRPLICYEAIFPQEIWTNGPRPDWMLQITNDGWFGTLAGPQQHFQQARFRAIEQGLPLVRVANTGVTAVVDPMGRITARLPFGVAGKLDTTLPARVSPTLYSRTGDLPVFLLLLAGLAALLLCRGRN